RLDVVDFVPAGGLVVGDRRDAHLLTVHLDVGAGGVAVDDDGVRARDRGGEERDERGERECAAQHARYIALPSTPRERISSTNLAGTGAVTTFFPGNTSRLAWSNGHCGPSGFAPYKTSPRSGKPDSARCTRIWCRRPGPSIV